MSNTKKLSVASLFVAVGVVLSGFYIPVGVSKVFPVQHMINLVAAVMLGPFYAVLTAFATSVIRVSAGTGSLLAFPGSMVGACLAGVLYRRYRCLGAAFVGEFIGTGLLGAIIAYPVAALLLSKEVALLSFVIPFSMSSAAGALIGLAGIISLEKTGMFYTKIEGGL